MRPGETLRVFCFTCLREADITYEPKVRDGAPAEGIESADIFCCPFCGSENLEAP